MEILFNDPVVDELSKVANGAFLNAVKGRSEQFLYNIDVYLRNAPKASDLYINRGAQLVTQVESKKAIKDITSFDKMYLAIFGMLGEHVFVGIDMTKEGYPSALYTRSEKWLRFLFSKGRLSGIDAAGFEKIVKSLKDNKTALGFEDNTFMVVRLDVVSTVNGVVYYKPVIPRSRVSIGVGKDFVFIPITFMHAISGYFMSLKSPAFKFTKTSVVGQRIHTATCKPKVVTEVYKSAPQNLVGSKLLKTRVGYNEATLRFECYDLESSVYSIGSASFRPEMLDKVKEVKLGDIDTSFHMVNINHLKGIFKTRVNHMKVADFANFKFFDTSSFPTVDKKAEALINWSEDVDGRDLITIMKTYPTIFGDINKSLASRERNSPHVLKQLQIVQGHYTVDSIKELLKTGVVRITALSKNNKAYERLCSNSPKVLSRMLGKDYVAKFESSSHRLDGAIAELDAMESPTKDDLQKLLVKYDLLSLVDSQEFMKLNPKSVLMNAKANIDSGRKYSPDYIVYRKLEAKDRNDFYGQVSINNIISVEYAPFN